MPSIIEMMDELEATTIDCEGAAEPANRDRILSSLPEYASGPAMSSDRYQALRRYIAENAPIRLVDYHCGIGTMTAVTPPKPEVPAGTITMICDNGSHVDGDTRCFTYPDGSPVADVHWTAYMPSPETSGIDI
ncbi:MAG: hypothetical protein ACYC4F_01265 [Armatimonadota bacterium]